MSRASRPAAPRSWSASDIPRIERASAASVSGKEDCHVARKRRRRANAEYDNSGSARRSVDTAGNLCLDFRGLKCFVGRRCVSSTRSTVCSAFSRHRPKFAACRRRRRTLLKAGGERLPVSRVARKPRAQRRALPLRRSITLAANSSQLYKYRRSVLINDFATRDAEWGERAVAGSYSRVERICGRLGHSICSLPIVGRFNTVRSRYCRIRRLQYTLQASATE